MSGPAARDIIMPAECRGAVPVARQISLRDLGYALRQGCADFRAAPTHVPFLCLLYPASGLLLARCLRGGALWPLLVSLGLVAAVTGPLAAAALYELSRRREQQIDASWRHVGDVVQSPSLGPLLGLGVLLLILTLGWFGVEQRLYVQAFGDAGPATPAEFADRVVTTPEGAWLVRAAVSLAAIFIGVVIAGSTIAFPLVLDRRVSIAVALTTSVKVAGRNPEVMIAWGFVVAAGIAVGLATALIGFAVVVPILGHASWHLYRRALTPPWGPRAAWDPPWRAWRLRIPIVPERREAGKSPQVGDGNAIREPPASPPGN